MPTLHTSVNIWLFLTALIESNAMKRLITLIFSAVLLSPVWFSAQTTPSILPPFSWAGTMELTQSSGIHFSYFPTQALIAKINLSIEVPNNNSASMGANGYFNCSITGSSPFPLFKVFYV